MQAITGVGSLQPAKWHRQLPDSGKVTRAYLILRGSVLTIHHQINEQKGGRRPYHEEFPPRMLSGKGVGNHIKKKSGSSACLVGWSCPSVPAPQTRKTRTNEVSKKFRMVRAASNGGGGDGRRDSQSNIILAQLGTAVRGGGLLKAASRSGTSKNSHA